MNRLRNFAAEARKFLVALAALLAVVAASGLLHGQAQDVAQAVLTLLGAFGVYKVKNADKADRHKRHTRRAAKGFAEGGVVKPRNEHGAGEGKLIACVCAGVLAAFVVVWLLGHFVTVDHNGGNDSEKRHPHISNTEA